MRRKPERRRLLKRPRLRRRKSKKRSGSATSVGTSSGKSCGDGGCAFIGINWPRRRVGLIIAVLLVQRIGSGWMGGIEVGDHRQAFTMGYPSSKRTRMLLRGEDSKDGASSLSLMKRFLLSLLCCLASRASRFLYSVSCCFRCCDLDQAIAGVGRNPMPLMP